MTQKISKTSNLSNNTLMCGEKVQKNIHSSHMMDNKGNGHFSNVKNSVPSDMKNNHMTHSFIHIEETYNQKTDVIQHPQLQVPLQDSIYPKQINNGSSLSTSHNISQTERGCIDLSLDVDFDIF